MVLMRFASFKRQETAKNAPKCDPKKLNAFFSIDVFFSSWQYVISPSHAVSLKRLKNSERR